MPIFTRRCEVSLIGYGHERRDSVTHFLVFAVVIRRSVNSFFGRRRLYSNWDRVCSKHWIKHNGEWKLNKWKLES